MRVPAVLTSLVVLVAAAGSATAGAPQAAAAKNRTVVLPIAVDWRTHQPEQHRCSAWGLVTWPEQKGAYAWKLFYKYKGQQYDRTLSPPFSDTLLEKHQGWSPGEGKHWYVLTWHSAAHASPSGRVDCDETQARKKTYYSDVRLEITLKPDTKIAGVVKAGGTPLPGVRVQAGRRSDRTDARGRYEIVVPDTTRDYRVRASKARLAFQPKARRVTARPGLTSRANFRVRGHVITGRVTQRCRDASASADPGDQQRCKPAVKGAKVTARKVGGGRLTKVVTRHDGTYVMIVQEKGRYEVTFSVDGRTWRKMKNVKRGRVVVSQDIGSRNAIGGRVIR